MNKFFLITAYVLALSGCLGEALIVPSVGKVIFCYFGLTCVAGIVFRWGPLIPATLLAFFFGQCLPYKHGYSHNAMESVEHDLIDPTIVATVIAGLLIWLECHRRPRDESPQPSATPSLESQPD